MTIFVYSGMYRAVLDTKAPKPIKGRASVSEMRLLRADREFLSALGSACATQPLWRAKGSARTDDHQSCFFKYLFAAATSEI